MSTSDPAWLQGLTSSPCSALVWQNLDQRQFCVLPFYEDGDRSVAQPHYAMWGRTLSGGVFCPVPPSMYRLELVRCTPEPDGTDWYQWNAEAHGKAPYSVPIEMQKVRAVEYGQDLDGTPLMDLEVPTVVTPEFVEERWFYGPSPSRRPTDFYPDVSLWSTEQLLDTMGDDYFPELPASMEERHVGKPVAPVQTYFCRIFKQICIRGSTTRLWDRERRPYQ